MPKSNYPNKIDTSVEIRPVRDNITEVGSDVINSLRSAIFQIEKTLGINPQGAAGSTVASRISSVIDETGKIKKDALDKANILAGPISDNDVSKDAAISESKLKLNFPTNLLQDEISIVTNKIDSFIAMLEELSALLSAHIHPEAINRHFAKAINLNEATISARTSATMKLESMTVQEAFELLYDAHINFSADGLLPDNNSHTASQIYYDNNKTSDFIDSNSAQGAIDQMVSLEGRALKRAMLNLHSNGLIRSGTVIDEFESLGMGTALIEDSPITYTGPSSSINEKVIFSSPVTPIGEISQFDIVTINGIADTDDSGDYIISDIELDANGDLLSVDIYGGPRVSASGGSTAKITKNIYSSYNENGLNSCVRPRYNKTNTPDIQIAHPNSATIITSGIEPGKITSTSGKFSIVVDESNPIEIDVFDEDFGDGGQTLDSIVYKINEFSVDNRLGFMAYKLRRVSCYELAISHIMPNISDDIRNRTLKIVEPTNNSGITALGFEKDIEAEGGVDNVCLINGSLVSNFGKIIKLSNLEASLVSGTTQIDSASEDVDFLNLGVREGDIVYISGSLNPSDDGPHRVNDVFSRSINIDFGGHLFEGSLDESSALYILRLSAHIGEMEFDVVGSNGGVLFDTFITDSADIFFKKRMVVGEMPETASFHAVVSGVSRNFISATNAKLIFRGGVGMGISVSVRDGGGDEGDRVSLPSSGNYRIFSASKMSYIDIEVKVFGLAEMVSPIMSIPLTGHLEVPPNAYLISRGMYSTNMGMVLGKLAGQGSKGGIPSLRDMRVTGTTDNTIISENFIERYIQGPRNELRGCGIIRGLLVKGIDTGSSPRISLSISAGIAVVNGIRYEYIGNDDFITYQNSNFFIGIDSLGCIVASEDRGGPSPFADMEVAHIAHIDIANNVITDLRLFVDHLDYKVVADITVANDQEFGHFTSIKKAVDYARVFTRLFPKMGRPSITVKEGTHIVNEAIIVDFDTMIRGAGPQTIIVRGEDLVRLHEEDNNLMFTANSIRSGIFIVGSKELGSSDDIVYGVTFSDFTIKTSELLSSGNLAEPALTNSMIFITQSLSDSVNAFFRFININFIGPKSMKIGELQEFAVVMTRPFDEQNRDNLTFGNLVVSNCQLSNTGNESASIGVAFASDNSNNVQNIILTSNVFSGVSPNEMAASNGFYSFFGVSNGEDDANLGFFGGEFFDGNVSNVIADTNVATDSNSTENNGEE